MIVFHISSPPPPTLQTYPTSLFFEVLNLQLIINNGQIFLFKYFDLPNLGDYVKFYL